MKPILFSTQMVQALLADKKTQTRREIKHPTKIETIRSVVRCCGNESDWGKFVLTDVNGEDFLITPKHPIGNILWVRETFYAYGHWTTISENGKSKRKFHDLTLSEGLSYRYLADAAPEKLAKKGELGWFIRPTIYMPFSAARIFLEVTDLRAERLQDISEEDAIAEGIIPLTMSASQLASEGQLYFDYTKPKQLFNDGLPPFWSFNSLWCSIYGGDSWDANPFVFAYTFKKVDKPNG